MNTHSSTSTGPTAESAKTTTMMKVDPVHATAIRGGGQGFPSYTVLLEPLGMLLGLVMLAVVGAWWWRRRRSRTASKN